VATRNLHFNKASMSIFQLVKAWAGRRAAFLSFLLALQDTWTNPSTGSQNQLVSLSDLQFPKLQIGNNISYINIHLYKHVFHLYMKWILWWKFLINNDYSNTGFPQYHGYFLLRRMQSEEIVFPFCWIENPLSAALLVCSPTGDHGLGWEGREKGCSSWSSVLPHVTLLWLATILKLSLLVRFFLAPKAAKMTGTTEE
jgi:hypothetical protein